MPRRMSFMLTKDQVRRREKTVTRRRGWDFLRVGDRVWAVEQCQGLKAGQRQVVLALVEVVKVDFEPLDTLTKVSAAAAKRELTAEGFPDMTPDQFIAMFLKANRGMKAGDEVTRVEFKYVEWEQVAEESKTMLAGALSEAWAEYGPQLQRSGV